MGRVLRPSDQAAVVGVIDPDAYAANTYTTDWIAVKNFEKFLAVISWGDLGENATVNAKFEQATDSSGTGAKDVTGKAITEQDATVSPQPNNKQALINLTAEELDVTNSFDYVRLSMTIGVATSDAGGMVLGFNPRYGPASDNDLSSVDEIVA